MPSVIACSRDDGDVFLVRSVVPRTSHRRRGVVVPARLSNNTPERKGPRVVVINVNIGIEIVDCIEDGAQAVPILVA